MRAQLVQMKLEKKIVENCTVHIDAVAGKDEPDYKVVERSGVLRWKSEGHDAGGAEVEGGKASQRARQEGLQRSISDSVCFFFLRKGYLSTIFYF